MSDDTIDKTGATIKGPIDRVFATLFQHAIDSNKVKPAVYMGWQGQRSVAWEVSEDGQLYEINRQNNEDGLIRRVTTKVRIKDADSLQLKSVEFRQVRKIALVDTPIVNTNPDAMLSADDYLKSDPFNLMNGEKENIIVTMSLHTTLPEAIIDGLKGHQISTLVTLPERFADVSGMKIKSVTPLNENLILCLLV